MKSSIMSMQEMHEKMKVQGGNKFNQFDERITNMERTWTWTKNMSAEVKITKKNM